MREIEKDPEEKYHRDQSAKEASIGERESAPEYQAAETLKRRSA